MDPEQSEGGDIIYIETDTTLCHSVRAVRGESGERHKARLNAERCACGGDRWIFEASAGKVYSMTNKAT